MKLKTFRIWLFLLPVVAIIGVLLFVQSTNNQEELEQQHIRSIASLAGDVQMALSDYLVRSEVYILRKGFAELGRKDSLGSNAGKVMEFLEGFNPEVIHLQYYKPDSSIPKETLFLEKGKVKIRHRKVYFRKETNKDFQEAVTGSTWIKGSAIDTSYVLVMNLDIPISELLRKVETHDFTFERFFLTNSKGFVLYPQQAFGTQIFKPINLETDSSGNFKTGISVHSIHYNQREYQAYSNALMLGDLKLHFLGIYEDAYFKKVGLRVDYGLLSILLFVLVVLVCSIPILAVVNMGKGDILTQSRIIQVGVSLMALAVVVGFTLSFIKNTPNPKATLSNEINRVNKGFLDSLDRYNSLVEDWKKGLKVRDGSFQINELITVDSLGFVNKINYYRPTTGKKLKVNIGAPLHFLDLKIRPYVSYFDRKNPKSSYISSHYSRGSGAVESVISKKDYLSKSNLYAVTFTHKLDSSLSNNFRIFLIKEDGSVIFKSSQVESSSSNLNESISSQKWTEISSLLRNNDTFSKDQPLETKLYLNGHQYEAYFSRLANLPFDQPLWSVFLINTNVFHVFSALTSLEGILFVLAYFLFLLFTLGAQQFARKNEDHQGFKVFLFAWLVPSEGRRGALLFLILSYLFLFVLLLFIFYKNSLNHVDTLFLFTVSSLLISYFNLFQAKIWDLKLAMVPNEMKTNVALLLAVSLFSAWISPHLRTPIILLLGYGFGVSWLMLKNSWWSKWELLKVSNRDHLVFYLTMWFFMIGFLPGYLIQSKTQQFEQVIWSQSKCYTTERTPNSTFYETARRASMSALSDPFDPKIQNFLYPNLDVVEAAWQGSKLNTTSNSILFLLFAGLLLVSFTVIKWVQKVIFFEFNPHFPTMPNEFSKYNFICCLSSGQMPKPINLAKTHALDFVFQSIPDDFPILQEDYIFYNVHCLKEYFPLSQLIAKIKEKGGTVTVYSGALWKNLYQSLTTEYEKIILSEVFYDFRFMVIEIAEMEAKYQAVEEEMLSMMKRRKAFYANIWTELCFEEKQVCFSYAHEGFFNFAAKETLLDLAQKGVIVPNSPNKINDGWKEWTLFSPVFRQFILTHLTKEELSNFRNFEKKNGNITTIQTAVISFVLICIALVGIFDKTFFNEAYTYLTGGLGILGTLYSVLNQGLSGLIGPKKEG